LGRLPHIHQIELTVAFVAGAVLVCYRFLTLYFASTLRMKRPNRKQWIVLWAGAAWTVGSLVIAEDYLVRALLAGLVVTALLFWQLSGRHDTQQPLGAAASGVPPTPHLNHEPRQPPSVDTSTPIQSNPRVLVDPEAQQRPEPSGMGGWLVLLLLGPLFTPVLTVYVVALYGEFWTDPWLFTLAIAGGILAGWSFYVALALLNRWPGAPKLAQAQLIVSCVFWACLVALAAITAGVDFSNSIPQLVGSFFGTLLWVSYLRDSRRVRATYGPMPLGPIKFGHARVIGLATGIFVCFFAIGIAYSRRQDWTEFRSEDGHYKVEAPGLARKSVPRNGEVQVAFGNDVRGFVVTSAVLAPEKADAQSYFEGVRNSVITNVKGSIINTSSVGLDGHPGIEFAATFPGKGLTGDLRGRVYRTDSEGFLLLVSGPQGGRTASDADRFFRSFQIKP